MAKHAGAVARKRVPRRERRRAQRRAREAAVFGEVCILAVPSAEAAAAWAAVAAATAACEAGEIPAPPRLLDVYEPAEAGERLPEGRSVAAAIDYPAHWELAIEATVRPWGPGPDGTLGPIGQPEPAPTALRWSKGRAWVHMGVPAQGAWQARIRVRDDRGNVAYVEHLVGM